MTRPMAFVLALAATLLIYAAGLLIGAHMRPGPHIIPAGYGVFEQAVPVEYSI